LFIRWIVRGHKSSKAANVTFHDAYLVESYRDDAGQPRQRTITYLGNIRQISETFPAIERELFMLRAELILNETPELLDADREDVLQQLTTKVPPLTKREVLRAFKSNLQWYFRWWRENGGEPSAEAIERMIAEASNRDDLISPD
jgi:hypothetical protein